MNTSEVSCLERHVNRYLDVRPVWVEAQNPGIRELTATLREPWANCSLGNREIRRYLEFLEVFPGIRSNFDSTVLLDMRGSTGAVDRSVRGYSFSKFFDVLALTTLVGGLTSGIFGAIYGNIPLEAIGLSNLVASPAFLGISDKFDWNLEIIDAWKDGMARARNAEKFIERLY